MKWLLGGVAHSFSFMVFNFSYAIAVSQRHSNDSWRVIFNPCAITNLFTVANLKEKSFIWEINTQIIYSCWQIKICYFTSGMLCFVPHSTWTNFIFPMGMPMKKEDVPLWGQQEWNFLLFNSLGNTTWKPLFNWRSCSENSQIDYQDSPMEHNKVSLVGS